MACATPIPSEDGSDEDGGDGDGDGDMLPILPSGAGGTTSSSGGDSGLPGVGGNPGLPGVGGSLFSSGGATGTGGAAAAGGAPPVSSASYPFTATASTISNGGYVSSSPWMGYAYTWVGSMGTASDAVYPAEFSDNNLCAWGTLGTSYNAILGLGIAVNQAQGTDTKGTWNISAATGITYNIKNDGGTPLRIQLKVGSTDYCTEVSAAAGTASGTKALTDFNTVCWESDTPGTQMPTTGTIDSIDIVSPGTVDAVRNPAFCIVSLSPALK